MNNCRILKQNVEDLDRLCQTFKSTLLCKKGEDIDVKFEKLQKSIAN